jgi:3-phytase
LEDTVTGIAVYASEPGTDDYLFVGLENAVAVYQYPWDLVGTLDVVGLEELEIQGLSVHQASLSKYPDGVLAYAVEAEDVQGFGISSLGSALAGLNIPVNTEYNPRNPYGCQKQTPITEQCSFNGFAQADDGCECFAGFSGEACSEVQCEDDCSGNGTCVGPDTCDCHDGWGGLHCSFVIVEPEFETDANGEDGDDPAIWVSPVSPELSRIITTTKAGDDAGLAVFDLEGNQLQLILAPEPNNVDIIYSFQAGNRTVDLAYAACRGDNTLW